MLKTVIITLAVIGTIGGGVALAKHGKMCDAEQRIEKVSNRLTDQLELNTNQQQHLKAFANQVLEIKTQHQEKRGEMKAQALALLEAERLDRAQANQLIDTKLQTLTDNKAALIDGFADFSDSLSPEQRQKLAGMIEDATSHRWGPRRWID